MEEESILVLNVENHGVVPFDIACLMISIQVVVVVVVKKKLIILCSSVWPVRRSSLRSYDTLGYSEVWMFRVCFTNQPICRHHIFALKKTTQNISEYFGTRNSSLTSTLTSVSMKANFVNKLSVPVSWTRHAISYHNTILGVQHGSYKLEWEVHPLMRMNHYLHCHFSSQI